MLCFWRLAFACAIKHALLHIYASNIYIFYMRLAYRLRRLHQIQSIGTSFEPSPTQCYPLCICASHILQYWHQDKCTCIPTCWFSYHFS
ncbi:hypothetical protein CIPAW_08G134500 [Carya illinoinensis]|uniref:Uncharacterized protein n=1 Tax=Carya illinoinensis TaxID=32201 RepID=A0A8T1PTP8_CARIL|nr:hypothetical protein CIPAW_08G134500 [Carya illinoinensis]